MGTISSELTTFKSSLEGSLGSMTSACSDIKSKLSELTNANSTVSSGISTYYNSTNSSTALTMFSTINDICSSITSSLDGTVQGAISEAQAIIDLVTELENINKEIETQQSIVNSNSGDTDDAKSKRSSAQSIINSKNSEFNTKHEQAKSKLAALKAKDSSLGTSSGSSSSSSPDTSTLTYGTFELKKFTTSEGKEIEYYIYVPNYGKKVDGLSVMLYMHGGSARGTSKQGWLNYGLTNKIYKKELTPSGIVIMPFIRNFERDNIEQSLKELTDSVVKQYNANPKKVAISGHSYGGITAYRMINKYPNYFSCCIPISGSYEVTSAFKNMKVWSFNGTYEGGQSNTGYKKCAAAVDEINKIGGKAYLTPIKTGHAGTNKDTYAKEYQSPEGEMINPLEWAFKQERA